MVSEGSGREDRASAGELTTALAHVQGMLLSEQDAVTAVEQLALVARDLVSGSVGAGASLIDASGRRTSTGTTDRVAAAADALQYELGEGPCLSAWATVAVQRIDDTATETRWGTWCAAVQGLGVRSALSAPMVFHGECLGALKVYSTAVEQFGTADEHRLVLLGGAAATLLSVAQDRDAPQRLSAGLSTALAGRRAVEAATGMLMERFGLDHGTARRRLMAVSHQRHTPLVELAGQVLERTDDSFTWFPG